ncbi:hypothetical protein PBY51_018526 [Eleginops maclovinus]|uniref:Uncharacterized protein n=1 Tax=Eleginops maclovinus TaxID=56733 RepID=A0AAN7Y9X0_ELEMC|nr:hypothetical protein PBY51_018526 [Eleginops maclovinus]
MNCEYEFSLYNPPPPPQIFEVTVFRVSLKVLTEERGNICMLSLLVFSICQGQSRTACWDMDAQSASQRKSGGEQRFLRATDGVNPTTLFIREVPQQDVPEDSEDS